MIYKHANFFNTLLLLHFLFMLSLVKMLLKGEVGGHALNSHENYIVDHGKSWNCVFEFLLEPWSYLRAFPEKNTWGRGGGEGETVYISMGGWCGKISNYMGHWCSTKSNYMGGWYFAAWKGKKENYLPKKREVLSNLAKRKR